LITEHIIETFKEYQPYCVEITLYGASENTYQSITGQTGMYEKCLSNIRALINAGIPTRLKTILLTKNYNEFEDMRQLAKDLDVQFRFDGMIFPCLNGDPSPIAYRISPEEVAEISLSCEKFVTDWEQTKERMKHVPASEFLYSCGAGVNNFHIDYSGLLKPCIMVNTLSHNLLTGSFQEGWYNVIPEIKKKKIPLEFACNNCENHIYCGYCPAFFRLETGSETKISEFLCRIGNRMNRLIREKNEAGAR
jgi:MoaA/NifB/PqqE/SkfB family radical SAM enzyme